MVNIGWVGNYERSGKNFGLAYRICRENNWNLLIAGGYDSGLFVKHSEMPEFYNECDVLLVTSYWEAHPLVVYEALACGVTVVMGRYVGDCFRNDLQGIVYYDDVDNTKNVVTAIHMALQYKEELSKAGVECINRDWCWKRVKQQYLNMFLQVSGKANPRVAFVTNEMDWSWGYMAKEIKQHIYPRLDIYSLNKQTPQKLAEETWKKWDIVLNHPWQIMYQLDILKNIPPEKHVLCVNGPAFLNPAYNQAWLASLASCSAISSVSMNVIDWLRFTGKPLFYATRGVDVEVFKPSFYKLHKEYLNSHEASVLQRLDKLGITLN